jgi:hypothetical protein
MGGFRPFAFGSVENRFTGSAVRSFQNRIDFRKVGSVNERR